MRKNPLELEIARLSPRGSDFLMVDSREVQRKAIMAARRAGMRVKTKKIDGQGWRVWRVV